MKRKFFQAIVRTSLVAVLALVSGCGTLEYRGIQDSFADAVAADNAWSVSPFGANASEAIYRDVHGQLTDNYIKGLDSRLQANAWMVRSVAAWRLGKFPDARKSAENGVKQVEAGQKGSRDHVMLVMLDGLIIDSDLREKFRAADGTVDATTYEPYAPDFETALAALDAGYAVAGAATPPDIGYYYNYQRWRLLQNWRTVLSTIPDDADESRVKFKDAAAAKVGSKLDEAADAARNLIPVDHPLHRLIVWEELR